MAYSQDVSIDIDETPPYRIKLSSNGGSPAKKSTAPSSKVYDVIIVGAGISGLYTARCLREEGLDVLVLEATDRVGGRILTLKDPIFGAVDIGGSHVGRLQNKVLALVRELGLELYRKPTQGQDVFFYKDHRYRHTEGKYPSTNPLVVMDMTNAMRCLDNMSKQVPINEPWSCKKAEKWDSMTVQDFLLKVCWFELTSTYLGIRLGQIFHSRLEDVSLLYCLHTIRSCGGCQALFTDNYNIREMKVKGGAGQLCDKMAEHLADVIEYDSPVTAIHQGLQGVVVKTENNNEYKCQHVAFATSPCVLKNVTFYPLLPDHIKNYIDVKPQSQRIQSILFYEKPFWRDQGCRGQIASDDGIVSMANENSGPDGKPLAISSMVDGLEYGGLTREDRKLQLAGQFSSIFESPEMRVCSGYMEKDWADFVARRRYGPPVLTLPPGVMTRHKRLWGTSYDRIHFAGTEAALGFRSCIEGALRAGESVSREIVESMKLPEKRCYDVDDGNIPYGKKPLKYYLLPSVPQFLIILVTLVVALVVLIIVISVIKTQQDRSQTTVKYDLTPAYDVTTASYDVTTASYDVISYDFTTALPPSLNVTVHPVLNTTTV